MCCVTKQSKEGRPKPASSVWERRGKQEFGRSIAIKITKALSAHSRHFAVRGRESVSRFQSQWVFESGNPRLGDFYFFLIK